MLRRVLVVGGSTLLLKLVYDQYVADSIPDKVIADLPILGKLDTDDIGLAVIVGLFGGVLASAIRGVGD